MAFATNIRVIPLWALGLDEKAVEGRKRSGASIQGSRTENPSPYSLRSRLSFRLH
jgi:hypothetical protein